jgi:hypothetical protein
MRARSHRLFRSCHGSLSLLVSLKNTRLESRHITMMEVLIEAARLLPFGAYCTL